MYENNTYCLHQVLDHNGAIKNDALYLNRVGCLTKNIRKGHVASDGSYVICMTFSQDEHGMPINRTLRTSPVTKILETDGRLEIHTQNSIYVFREAKMSEPCYLDEANLIELFLSDEGYQFCAGFYYDEMKNPHKLHEYVHVGMFQDSVLIHFGDNPGDTACRYFPFGNVIEFYDTLYHQQPYEIPMLIHNQGCESLTIRFQGFRQRWSIEPGAQTRIIPPTKKTE